MRKNFTQKIQSLPGLFFRAVCPSGGVEWGLFSFFVLFYAGCGFFVLFCTGLTDLQDGASGSYLGYDNFNHFRTRGGGLDFSHPFINLFHFLKYVASLPFFALFGAKGAFAFCFLLMNLTVSSALSALFKYLKRVVGLPLLRCLLLTVFCGFFFTVMVLSFTVETYPFSFLFLMVSLFLLSTEYRANGRFSGSTALFCEFLCGGITITNAVKPLSALLLNSGRFKEKAVKILKLFLPFFLCVVVVTLFYSVKAHLEGEDSPLGILYRVSDYVLYDSNFAKQAFMDYWSSSMLVTPLARQTFLTETVLRPTVYPHIWQYLFSASLLVLFLLSLFLNRKNRLVQLTALFVLVDVLVHFVFRYGIYEAIIFGGHWLFLVPVVLGWLYTCLAAKPKAALLLDAYLILFTVALFLNNVNEILTSFPF